MGLHSLFSCARTRNGTYVSQKPKAVWGLVLAVRMAEKLIVTLGLKLGILSKKWKVVEGFIEKAEVSST